MKVSIKSVARILVAALMVAVFTVVSPVHAEDDGYHGIGVSPMKEKIILNPGETYKGSFTVTNPARNTGDFNYKVSASPFFATEDYDITYEKTGDYNQIVDWVTIENKSGTLSPNQTVDIKFKIEVPKNAPAGGQYVAIIVRSGEDNSGGSGDSNMGVQINQNMGIAHTVFAEITGTSTRSGKISSLNLPGFMFDGKIAGDVTVQNTGNVHGVATYTLQVFPLFSNEEIYTNEEEPDTSIILPDRTLFHKTVWEGTPMVGVFNVAYTVEFEGMTESITKLVIVCPLWLVFIVLLVVIALIIWIVIKVKSYKKPVQKEEQ